MPIAQGQEFVDAVRFTGRGKITIQRGDLTGLRRLLKPATDSSTVDPGSPSTSRSVTEQEKLSARRFIPSTVGQSAGSGNNFSFYTPGSAYNVRQC
jgi:hypothetical protein